MEGRAKKHQDIVPALARMNQVDADACGQHPDSYARQGPMAAKYANLTPYNYAFNDPVLWNDPSGDDPWNNGPYAGSMAYYYAVQLSYGGKSPGQEAIMDAGSGKYATFGYWNPATAGGYGVQVGAYLNSMGYYNLEQQNDMRRERERQQRIIDNAVDKAMAFIAVEKKEYRFKKTYDRTFWGMRVETGGKVVGVKEKTSKQVYFQPQRLQLQAQQGGYVKMNQTYDFSRIGYVPLDEQVGYQISKYEMQLSVQVVQVAVYENLKLVGQKWQAIVDGISRVSPPPVGDLSSNVNVSLIINGQTVSTSSLSMGGTVITPGGWSYIGEAVIDLPLSGLNVQLQITGGWVVSGPEGRAVPVYHPLFAPVPINVNQTVNLYRY